MKLESWSAELGVQSWECRAENREQLAGNRKQLEAK
jgi:hypothetical protein